MAVASLALAVASVLAGASEQGFVAYETWTYLTTIVTPVAYVLMLVGLSDVITEDRAARLWWVLLVPAAIAVAALLTGFPLERLYRGAVFLICMGGFSAASAALVMWDPKRQRLTSRFGLAAAFGAKAVTAAVTFVALVVPDSVQMTPAAAFLVLILSQFAIAMFVLILVQERAEQRLIALTETDSLTGIRNRHWMMDRLPREAPSGSAYVIIDIDHFKQVNDRLGHLAGDEVLTSVAQAMTRQLGRNAILARMGGEEFGLYLPAATEADAVQVAEQLRLAIASLSIAHDGNPIGVTLSAGVAVAPKAMSFTQLIGRADEALYAAKRGGRNRVVLARFENITHDMRLPELDAAMAAKPA
jgi:diguanylate cyclase (GGDEF)-like protein